MHPITRVASKDPRGGDARSARRVAPAAVHDVLASPGRPLDEGWRARFEPRFGRSFADVRVHDDRPARQSADAVGAAAYTLGEHVVLGEGRSSSATVAHELAHVAQAPRTPVPRELPIAPRDAPAERAAEAAASAVLGGAPLPPASARRPGGAPALHRQAKPDEARPGQKKPGEPGQQQPGQQKPDEKKGEKEEDEPPAWLTLQGQGLLQLQFPIGPQFSLDGAYFGGGQLAVNLALHSDPTGFEVALVYQGGRNYSHRGTLFHGRFDAVSSAQQLALQPSWVLLNRGGNQLAAIVTPGYSSVSSKDPAQAGRQLTFPVGLQYTRDVAQLGPLKVQGVVSAGVGPGVSILDTPPVGQPRTSVYPMFGGAIGIQVALDVVKRDKHAAVDHTVPVPVPPPPPPPPEQQKQPDQPEGRKRSDEQRPEQKQPEQKQPEQKQPSPPPPPEDPLPTASDYVYFRFDQPRPGERGPAGEVLTGVTDARAVTLPELAERLKDRLGKHPGWRVMLVGHASSESPASDPAYNLQLGLRRAQWLADQLVAAGLDRTRIATPRDSPLQVVVTDGLASTGATGAAATPDPKDRFVMVWYHKA